MRSSHVAEPPSTAACSAAGSSSCPERGPPPCARRTARLARRVAARPDEDALRADTHDVGARHIGRALDEHLGRVVHPAAGGLGEQQRNLRVLPRVGCVAAVAGAVFTSMHGSLGCTRAWRASRPADRAGPRSCTRWCGICRRPAGPRAAARRSRPPAYFAGGTASRGDRAVGRFQARRPGGPIRLRRPPRRRRVERGIAHVLGNADPLLLRLALELLPEIVRESDGRRAHL